jgi:hypothetical protein
MIQIEVDAQSQRAYGKAIRETNAKISRNITNAWNKELKKQHKKYQSDLNRTYTNLYKASKGRKRGKWKVFYKRLAKALYADEIQEVAVGSASFFGASTNETMFSVDTGFYEDIGSGGESLPGLYYFGKGVGDPIKKRIYVKATVGNPVMTRLVRGAARAAYMSGGAGKYVLPEGYVSQEWKNIGKKRFQKYADAIQRGFEREGDRVLREMNR